MKYIEIEQNTPAWHDFRRNHIGASDAAAILGVSPWKTPFQLWEEKLGLSKPKETSSAMQRGKDMEMQALKAFEEKTGFIMFPKVVKHPQYDWMIASLDGIDFDKHCIVEIKCPGKADHATALDGEIPAKYKPQLQHQLAVTGLKMVFYFSYHPESNVCISMERDEGYIENLIEQEKLFWQCVQNFEPPELSDRDCIEITDPLWMQLASDYKHYSNAVKDYEAEMERIKIKLIALSNGQNAIGAGVKLMKSFRKGAVDIDAIASFAGVDKELFRKKPTNYWRIS